MLTGRRTDDSVVRYLSIIVARSAAVDWFTDKRPKRLPSAEIPPRRELPRRNRSDLVEMRVVCAVQQ